MNLARWSIDYVQKKSKAEPSPRPRSITDMVVEEKRRRDQQSGTPEHIQRILAADEAQLDVLTQERSQLFVADPTQKDGRGRTLVQKATPKRLTNLGTEQRDLLARKNKE